MSKTAKKFNWKARQVKETVIDNAETSKIKVETDGLRKDKFDAANPLVLPSQKRKTQLKKQPGTVTKILSRKQRKRLEKIVDKKKKKENRSQLLQTLSEFQAKPEVLKELTSIASLQTKGLKRIFQEEEASTTSSKKSRNEEHNVDEQSGNYLSSLSGSKKRKALLKAGLWKQDNQKQDSSNANVVGFETSSNDSSDEEENEEEVEEEEVEEKNSTHQNSNCKDENESIESDKDDSDSANRNESVPKEQNVIAKPLSDTSSKSDISGMRVEENSSDEKKNVDSKPSSSFTNGMAPKIKLIPPRPAVYVAVNRKPEIQEARLKLPVIAEEQAIMEAIAENPVVIIAGETGSGKTTQVPQFLFEAGYAKDGKIIGVTEPRRVAAISMSKRIAEEMNLTSKEVSYLIRFEGNVTENTKIKFMTDGVLLKEIQSDFLLNKYSVIVLDEAHERSVYTDILIGLLSRIVPLRLKRGNPLKLIIMSATLRLEDFVENPRLFRHTPPVIKIETRQFPVTIHFNKRTNPDYCLEAYRKACKIHAQLPDGGILIFLTGQREVNNLVRKLRTAFPVKNKKLSKLLNAKSKKKKAVTLNDGSEEENEDEINMERAIQKARQNSKKKKNEKTLPDINLDEYAVMPYDDTETDLFGGDEDGLSDDDAERFDDIDLLKSATSQPLWVLPLYSILPSHEQAKVFQPPPEGCRLCIVATNVAETSLTIPNVKYVVDCGKWKSRMYDKVTGISSFDVDWCSKASANQRAGRAGRTGPGHCYRLYSSAVFNDTFPMYTTPEIQRKPVDDLVLQMKSMSIHKVINFPFPSAPDLMQIKVAERRLRLLGALTAPAQGKEDDYSGKLTSLGQAISAFPVSPRFGKMLALSHQHDLLALTVCLVAALSVQEVLLEVAISDEMTANSAKHQWNLTRRKWAGLGNSKLLGDPMVLLRAVGAAEYAAVQGDLLDFCTKNGLRHKAIVEIRKLRVQLTNEVNLNVTDLNLSVDPNMSPPTDMQAKLLRQVLLSGLVDQVAKRVDPEELKEGEDKRKWKHAYQIPEMESPVFMHSSSVLRKELPEWVVYQEIYETNKTYMRGVTAIEPEWLPVFAPGLCNISEPKMDPPPRYDAESDRLLCHVSSTFGRSGWPLPIMELDFPSTLDRYKWFARFLLEGCVFSKLAQFSKVLLSTPGTMVKTWANLQPRTEVLLKALVSKELDSASKLRNVWKKEPNYLLEAYKKWLPESAHPKAIALWPPL
ncbi:putative ATP-dependent RNA helicase kurz [Frankliniella fusca]|uniref:RNA helicase n=1 Tax=Frankliniella fusca TaxID=407009 RepID=A0AAE1LBJ9_9NEOP|nr:putative ATP-dependent RNA helicase kurz [Frankliniella fusca]